MLDAPTSRRIAIHHAHPRSLFEKPRCSGRPNSARAAGYQYSLILQPSHLFSLPIRVVIPSNRQFSHCYSEQSEEPAVPFSEANEFRPQFVVTALQNSEAAGGLARREAND
jgi:hypothetical protein